MSRFNLFALVCACSLLLFAFDVAAQEVLCEDSCASAGDGECDDGGPDSLYDLCSFGSDCTDCGPRVLDEAPDDVPGEIGLCDDSCASAGDGECDDGGPDSLYDVCALGTDCTDCGPR